MGGTPSPGNSAKRRCRAAARLLMSVIIDALPPDTRSPRYRKLAAPVAVPLMSLGAVSMTYPWRGALIRSKLGPSLVAMGGLCF
jgi:hypothetical protein